MIVITGATGNVGRPLVQALAVAGEEVTAVSRKISAKDVPAGVRYQQGDLADPASLNFDDAKAVFLLTSGDFLGAGHSLGEVIEVARAAGVSRVVLLSSQGVGTGHHPSMLEDAVTASGLEWTILRAGNFASNAYQWAESVRTQRIVAAPFADIALPAVDPADIADLAAAALLEPGHDRKIYDVTGPALISPRQQAATIGEAIGETVRFTELTRAEARAAMVRFMPERVVEATLDALGTPPAEFQRVSPDVERVLGGAPRPFAEWVARNVAAFK